MKKTVLLLLLVLILSCSKDDAKDTQAQDQGCYMRVLTINQGSKDNAPFYQIYYGTSKEDNIDLVITEKVYQFYTSRISKGNDHWIGEVDHE